MFSSCSTRASATNRACRRGCSVSSAQLKPLGLRGGMASITVMLSRVGGNRSAMARGSGSASLSGMLKGRPSGKMPRACTSEDGTVVQRLGVQFQPHQAERREPQRGGGKLDGIFEIAALHLKMVRPQVHAFRPHHSRQELHNPCDSL